MYFGGQEANAAIERNAALLAERLAEVIAESGAEKVNIIAHSKGGLEARYLISALGMGGYVASLTTISTPHSGSAAMDKLMKLPRPLMKLIGAGTDLFKRIGGDKKPDTYRCFEQLTSGFMERFNAENPDDGRVYYQSLAFLMKSPLSDILMAVPYIGVMALNGKSDGFLTPDEVKRGEFCGIFTGAGRRGVSHCDEVDLRRTKLRIAEVSGIRRFPDITALYVYLASRLREQGF